MARALRAPFVALGLTIALTFALVLQAAPPASAQTAELSESVTGEVFDDETGDLVGDFAGDINITDITRDGDELNYTGTITGDVLDADGDVVDTIDTTFETTGDLTSDGVACQILFLELGPLELDLLGLVVEIPDPIVLDVRAEPGSGQLLGNLLCAVAGLLDGPGLGGGILNAVDRILDRISGLLS